MPRCAPLVLTCLLEASSVALAWSFAVTDSRGLSSQAFVAPSSNWASKRYPRHACLRPLISSRPTVRMVSDDNKNFEEWYSQQRNEKTPQNEKPQLRLHTVSDKVELSPLSFRITQVLPSPETPWQVFDAEQAASRCRLKALSLKGMAGDWNAFDALQAEKRALQGLSSYKGICGSLGDWEIDRDDDRIFYYAYTLPKGAMPLKDMISQGWRPTEDDIFDIGLALLEIVQHLETLRPPYVHGYIRPDSILVAQDDGEEDGGVRQGKWRVWLEGFAEGKYLGDAEEGRGGDAFGAGTVLLYAVSGKEWDEFEFKDGRPAFLRKVVASGPLKSVLEGLLTRVDERYPNTKSAAKALREARFDTVPRQETLVGASSAIRTYRPLQKPEGSRVVLTRNRERIDVVIPEGGLNAQTVASGSFSIAWTAIIGMWTATALTGGAPLIFAALSAPFWLAGAGLAKQTVMGAAGSQSLSVSEDGVILASYAFGKVLGKEIVERNDLRDVSIVTRAYVNGRPIRTISLLLANKSVTFGESLSDDELVWIVSELREFAGLPFEEYPMPPMQDQSALADRDRF